MHLTKEICLSEVTEESKFQDDSGSSIVDLSYFLSCFNETSCHVEKTYGETHMTRNRGKTVANNQPGTDVLCSTVRQVLNAANIQVSMSG